MELNELKVRAYDLLAGIEQLQMQLRQVNQQMTNLKAKPVKPEAVEVAKDKKD